jgi:Zn-dependent alcohol dehydrogenase
MKKPNQIIEVSLPHPEASELVIRAAQAGVPAAEYIGIQALAGAYGNLHPVVVEFRSRDKAGVFGTKTLESES